MGIKFVNLHSHTNGSLGDAIGRAEDHFNFVIENAGEDSMAMAITDHGNANEFGHAFAAQQKYKKKGIPLKMLWGAEMYLHPDLDEWKRQKDEKKEEKEEEASTIEIESETKDKAKWYNPLNRRHHLVLIAQNQIGLKNLYRIISESYKTGFYRFPRTDFKHLEKYNEGLMISSACCGGLPTWLALRDETKSKEEIFKVFDDELKPLLDIFGKDRAFLEIQFNKLPQQMLINGLLQEYSKISGYKAVATADSHYHNPAIWREREIYRLLAQQSRGYDVGPDDLPKTIDELKCELYPRNGDQMFQAYKDYNPELDEQFVLDSITRTYDIAHGVCEDIQFDTSYKLPFSFLAGKDPFTELTQLCFDGLEAKGLSENDEYVERLAKELKVIKNNGLSTYFLTLERAIRAVKKSLLVGVGRGSGSSSMVNYVLNITLVDPIKNGLIFERFISESRKEPADVDTDSESREQTIEVLRQEFGEDNVVAISNFNGLQLKSLVKDISKFYGIDFQEVNAVTSIMEQEARQPILDSIGNDQKLYVFDYDGAMKHSNSFKKFITKYPLIGESIKVLFKQNKSFSKHAGGVVISENTNEIMPLIRIKGQSQTPWSEGLGGSFLGPQGIIKYDFLSLATLRTVRNCIERILKKEGSQPSFENVMKFYNENIHPDVTNSGRLEVYEEIYHKGKFCGTFQFTETNAQAFCKNAKPTSIEDISAITSLFRPGPLKGGADKKYLEAKFSEDEIVYDHPILKEVLSPTYGTIAYQEQFMILAHRLAGFSLVEADELRKMLMKPLGNMAEEIKQKRKEAEQRFIQGCIASGLDKTRATILWEDEILGFISYGFVKAHSISYAILSYQCSFLFYYYPDEWVTAYLECDPDKDNAMKEVKAAGYNIADIDILNSTKEWTVNSDTRTLYPPLSAVKGIGDAAIEELLSRRSSWQQSITGPLTQKEIFQTFFYDLETKTLKNGTIKEKKVWHFSKFNKRPLESLCKTESLNGLGIIGKGCLFENHAHFHNAVFANWTSKEKNDFDIEKIAEVSSKKDWSNDEKISFQLEILGTVPRDMILTQEEVDTIESCGICNIRDLADPEINGAPYKYWFVLTSCEQVTGKSGKPYWKLSISNLQESNITFNYFNKETRDGFVKFGVYVADFYVRDGWINIPRGSFIDKIG